MTTKLVSFYTKISFIEKLKFILLLLLPINLIAGNFLINLNFLLIGLIFIVELIKKKNFSFTNDYAFKFILFFFISLLINLFFSIDPVNSSTRILKVLPAIAFVFLLKEILNKYTLEFEKIIFGFWSIIFFILIIDALFETYFGYNLYGFLTLLLGNTDYGYVQFGFGTLAHGRVSSFFGDELIIGSFVFGFALIFLSYIFKFFNNSNKILLPITLVIIVIASFLIGERSNFIKVFLSVLILFFIIYDLNVKKKILSFFLIILTISLLINLNSGLKERYYGQIKDSFNNKKLIKENNYGINKIIKNSHYGAHYNAAFKIFKDSPIFGIGIKNYRLESSKKKYENKEYRRTRDRWATHPHSIHFEFLSETGIFGYFCFLIFIILSLYCSIKNYLRNRNNFQLSGIIFILIYIFVPLPSGSFFSTFGFNIFWINYAIMVAYNKNSKV